MNLYNVIDLETNTIKKNLTSDEIAKLIGTYNSYVSYLARNNTTFNRRYQIEKVGKLPPKCEPMYPSELLDEWDRVTKMFRARGFVS